MPETLLGSLITRFSTSPENIATESLKFILDHSLAARMALAQLLESIGGDPAQDLIFETQDHDHHDNSIPDLVGITLSGQPKYYFESKFWAGLTSNQPITYMNRATKTGAKGLIFITPAARLSTIWPELVRRCNNEMLILSEQKQINEHIIVAKFNSDLILGIITWRAILNRIQIAMIDAGEDSLAENVNQLFGLTEKMDTKGFVPFTAEDLTPFIGRRIDQYFDLVDEVTAKLVALKIASTKGLSSAGSREGYLRYFLIKDRGCSLRFSLPNWIKMVALLCG